MFQSDIVAIQLKVLLPLLVFIKFIKPDQNKKNPWPMSCIILVDSLCMHLVGDT